MGVMENGSKILSAFSVLARFPFERLYLPFTKLRFPSTTLEGSGGEHVLQAT